MSVDTLQRMPHIGAELLRSLGSSIGPRANTLPTRTLRITDCRTDPERYHAYLRVCGFPPLAYLTPTWLHVLSFPLHMRLMAGRDAPYPLAGLVHAQNEMTAHRPVQIEQNLDYTAQIVGAGMHRRGVILQVAATAAVAGELVWEGTSTYLALGRKLPDTPAQELAQLPPVTAPACGKWQLPASLGRQYARVSGDPNPIHLSALTAKPFGFKKAIIHGMWTHARALAALEPRLPSAYQVQVSWTKPIMLPACVRFAAEARKAPGADNTTPHAASAALADAGLVREAASSAAGWGFAVRRGEKTHMLGQLVPLP